ncbi:unnamed protein product, partial [Polarella glacialis]
ASAPSSGVSGKQFCCACIIFLGTVLVVQVCVLVTLVRRLSEVNGLVSPADAGAIASEALRASSAASASPFLRPLGQSSDGAAPVALDAEAPLPAGDSQRLAVAAAVGVGTEAILVFLVSFLRASPSSRVVMLVDQIPSTADLEAEGVDITHVAFERIPWPLPPPWNSLPSSDARPWLFKNYLERQRLQGVQLLQLSDVEDVAFQ